VLLPPSDTLWAFLLRGGLPSMFFPSSPTTQVDVRHSRLSRARRTVESRINSAIESFRSMVCRV